MFRKVKNPAKPEEMLLQLKKELHRLRRLYNEAFAYFYRTNDYEFVKKVDEKYYEILKAYTMYKDYLSQK
ncbi:hypothetical protein Csac_1442 [Caldicellulosiruptor saccharolyticus DSM 8903]|uniref:Uncharacterized protein n=1 Tax=Caldicellulosiruptor saccharolyticus (strain ATCC 43494 / DSM 8903 / Tp8T 6331) TaxID=351627 RepID=A4XJF8_CALS8|nr:hypothetical protein [Caldicellulosiruptor saccharolyticus]ABP67043.1 hypothetical protein Csac_1442 [Caldicellulosiruptor saccharolyticus DSM 8903]